MKPGFPLSQQNNNVTCVRFCLYGIGCIAIDHMMAVLCVENQHMPFVLSFVLSKSMHLLLCICAINRHGPMYTYFYVLAI